MKKIIALTVCLALIPIVVAAAEAEKQKTAGALSSVKELSGMSIVGNDEAPKSLHIVPWKSADIGMETSLRMVLETDDGPLDRDVFKRRLGYYEASKHNKTGRIN